MLYSAGRIAAAMWLQKSRNEETHEESPGGVYATLLWLLGLATIGIGLWWGPLESISSLARLR